MTPELILHGDIPGWNTLLGGFSAKDSFDNAGWNDDSWGDWSDTSAEKSKEEEEEEDEFAVPVTTQVDPSLLVSISGNGEYVAFASRTRFHILKYHHGEKKYDVVGLHELHNHENQQNGVEKEEITCISLLPVLSSTSIKAPSVEMYLLVGFTSGFFRVYSENATQLFAYRFELSSIREIRMTTHSTHELDRVQEILVVYANRTLAVIEGTSLWMSIRYIAATDDPTAQSLSFAKYHLTILSSTNPNSAEISSVLSLGPRQPLSSSLPVEQPATTFLAIGYPLLTIYSSTSTPRFSLSSLVRSQTVEAVTSAVMGFAKSFFSTSLSQHPSRSQEESNDDEPGVAVPSTKLVPTFSVSDSHRHALRVHENGSTGVICDSLGRVLVVDMNEFEIVRVFKGLRGAQCGWVPVRSTRTPNHTNTSWTKNNKARKVLAIYNTRGHISIYSSRHGDRIGILQTTKGGMLVQSSSQVLGSLYGSMNELEKESCWFLDAQGRVFRVEVAISDRAHDNPDAALVDAKSGTNR